MALEVGKPVPDFELPDTDRNKRKLSDYRGKNVVLAFYPGAFTGVCDNEMCSLNDSLANFSNMNAEVIGVSVDSPWANKAFAEKYNLKFPLLSDHTREVSQRYDNVFAGLGGIEGYNVANRSVFVIDKDGILRYKWTAPNPGVEPDYNEIQNEVSKLK